MPTAQLHACIVQSHEAFDSEFATLSRDLQDHPLSATIVFFFLMIRPPPRSSLFPFPTLFRSVVVPAGITIVFAPNAAGLQSLPAVPGESTAAIASRNEQSPSPGPLRSSNVVTVSVAARSEEHTSELQSQSNLVCRLLLEKQPHARRVPAPGATPDLPPLGHTPPCHRGGWGRHVALSSRPAIFSSRVTGPADATRWPLVDP